MGTTLMGSDTSAPYSLSYNTRLQTTNGTKAITAKAYDTWNNAAASAAVSVAVVLPAVAATGDCAAIVDAGPGDTSGSSSRGGTTAAAPTRFSNSRRAINL